MNKHILENIEPFNDVLYKNCFYNAYFPVVHHYGRTIMPFLANDIIVYGYNKNEKGIKLNREFVHCEDLEQLSAGIGMYFDKKVECEDPMNDIIDAITCGRPVIVSIDSFYEPFRSDTYRKMHWPHSILIYGYDDDEQVFHIMEHKNRENLAYEKRTIDYLDLVNAYYGYKANFDHIDITNIDISQDFRDMKHGEGHATFFACYAENKGVMDIEKEKSKYSSLFARNISLKKDVINNGLDGLILFMDDFKGYVQEEQCLSKVAEELANTLNTVINAKLLEKYRIGILLDNDPELLSIIDAIIDYWGEIRAAVVKYIYSSKYKQQTFINAIETMQKMIELERGFYCSLFLLAN
jgi:hypothetical protein